MIDFIKRHLVTIVFSVQFSIVFYFLHEIHTKHRVLVGQVTQMLQTQININKELKEDIAKLRKAHNVNGAYLYELANIVYEQFPHIDMAGRLTTAIEKERHKGTAE